jgi:hypothetical protein
LELTDPGFDFSVLSEFRARLMEGKASQKMFDQMLEQFKPTVGSKHEANNGLTLPMSWEQLEP